VLVAATEAELTIFKEQVRDLRAKSFTHEELIVRGRAASPRAGCRRELSRRVVSRRDGAAIPFRTTQAFRRKAEALGAVIP
jgi:sarcosine oxidase, subunit beta